MDAKALERMQLWGPITALTASSPLDGVKQVVVTTSSDIAAAGRLRPGTSPASSVPCTSSITRPACSWSRAARRRSPAWPRICRTGW